MPKRLDCSRRMLASRKALASTAPLAFRLMRCSNGTPRRARCCATDRPSTGISQVVDCALVPWMSIQGYMADISIETQSIEVHHRLRCGLARSISMRTTLVTSSVRASSLEGGSAGNFSSRTGIRNWLSFHRSLTPVINASRPPAPMFWPFTWMRSRSGCTLVIWAS